MYKTPSLATASYAFVLGIGLLLCWYVLPSNKQPTFVFYAGILMLSMFAVYFSEICRSFIANRISFWSGIFVLGIPMAFHEPGGSIDDANYMMMYEYAGHYSIYEITQYFATSGVENGYLFLTWILNKLTGDSYNAFQVIRTYITFFFWGFAIRKFTNRVGDGAIMVLFIWSHFYFFVLNSGLIRIFISLPLGLISLHFLLKNDLRKYLLFIALASVIHMSALVMLLLLPFLLNKDYYYKHWHSFVIISFLVVIISLLSMAAYLVPLLGDRYEGYGEVSDMSLSIGTFTTIPIFIAIYYYYKNMSFESVYAKKKFILGMVLIALSVVFSIATSMVHVGRISFYTYLGFLIVIPQIFRATARGIIGFLLKYLLIIYPLVYVMGTNMLNTAKTQLFPFKSFVNF